MIYNLSLWKDCNLDLEQFCNLIKSIKNNSIVNFFCAEEYEIKLNEGSRGWEIIKQSRDRNIEWNFVFGSADLQYYENKYHNKSHNLTAYLWPTFFINRSAYFLKKYNFTLKNNIDRLFISMNNLPRPHRCFLMDSIIEKNLQTTAAISWHQPDEEYNWKYWKPIQLLLSDNEYVKHCRTNQQNADLVPSIHQVPEEFFSSLISVVSESSVDHTFITEKTAIPLLLGQPFLVQGAVGFHDYLKTLGFELYDEIFDYSFDNEPDYRKRTLLILENLEFLKSKDYNNLYKKVYQKTIRNRHRAIEISKDSAFIPKLILNTDYCKEIYKNELSSII